MSSTIARLEFSVAWTDGSVSHNDRMLFPRVNFWRDFFPEMMDAHLEQLENGEKITVQVEPGKLVDPFDSKKIYRVLFGNLKIDPDKLSELSIGRYYPRGILTGMGFDPGDTRPAKVIAKDDESITIDCNHPLAIFPVTLSAKTTDSLSETHLRGGSSLDIGHTLTQNGPGMQAHIIGISPDYNIGKYYDRSDSSHDSEFYATPRLVNHVDEQASRNIAEMYRSILKPGQKVLDLMAAWNSHLPAETGPIQVTGLGMNQEELDKNPAIESGIVRDLNQDPTLPFGDGEFDAAICSVSIEYLIQPVSVFKEIGRVLKPGSPFMVTVSDRWFDPKVIQIWTALHPFERLGLITSYFQASGQFERIQTESIRGYPRPETDRYFPQQRESDPVFAVWGWHQ